MQLSPFERCQTCFEPYAEHVPGHKYGYDLGYACSAFKAYPRTNLPTKRIHMAGYRVREVGERVTPGDYLQIGKSFSLVDGSIWVGDIIEHVGPFSTVWTNGNPD